MSKLLCSSYFELHFDRILVSVFGDDIHLENSVEYSYYWLKDILEINTYQNRIALWCGQEYFMILAEPYLFLAQASSDAPEW